MFLLFYISDDGCHTMDRRFRREEERKKIQKARRLRREEEEEDIDEVKAKYLCDSLL